MKFETSQVRRDYVKFPADFPEDEQRKLKTEILHARSGLASAKKSGHGLKNAQSRLDKALNARSVSIKSFVDRVNTHTSLVVRQDGDRTRRLVQEDGDKTREHVNSILALASGEMPPEELQSATLRQMDAAVALMNPLRSKLRRAENKKRKAELMAAEVVVDKQQSGVAETHHPPETAGTSSSSTEPPSRATRAKKQVRAPVDFG